MLVVLVSLDWQVSKLLFQSVQDYELLFAGANIELAEALSGQPFPNGAAFLPIGKAKKTFFSYLYCSICGMQPFKGCYRSPNGGSFVADALRRIFFQREWVTLISKPP